jgi:poly(A) polymerase
LRGGVQITKKHNRFANDGTMKPLFSNTADAPSALARVARRLSGLFSRSAPAPAPSAPEPSTETAAPVAPPPSSARPPRAPRAPKPKRHVESTNSGQVIPRDGHAISRSKISPNALRVLYRLKDAGFESYLVGGAVRDLLLGLNPKDFDVATNATPEQVQREFRNCRLIGRRFRLAHVHFGQEIIEVATFRAAGSDDANLTDDGRLLRDNAYGTIEQDAIRRDFAVNALYYNIADFSVRDFVGGMADLNARTLKLIGPPEERMREDPVRILRAIRLSAKLDFSIDPATQTAARKVLPQLADVPPARLFDEVLKLLLAGFAAKSWAALRAHGVLEALFGDSGRILSTTTHYDAFLTEALANTDRRIEDGKPVTPAFLFAVLLWPAFRAAMKRANLALDAPIEDLATVADQVTRDAVARVALPRRFSQPMIEIWLLQDRFERRQGKRAERFLSHPRFRAAYDFLLLRALEEPRLAPLARWWTDAQSGQTPAVIAAESASTVEAGDESAPVRKRRRRRRKPRPDTAPDPAAASILD